MVSHAQVHWMWISAIRRPIHRCGDYLQKVQVEDAMRKLTPYAQQMRDLFMQAYSGRACMCSTWAKCAMCIHQGNPANQEGDDSCWIEVPEPTSPLVNDAVYRKRVSDW